MGANQSVAVDYVGGRAFRDNHCPRVLREFKTQDADQLHHSVPVHGCNVCDDGGYVCYFRSSGSFDGCWSEKIIF